MKPHFCQTLKTSHHYSHTSSICLQITPESYDSESPHLYSVSGPPLVVQFTGANYFFILCGMREAERKLIKFLFEVGMQSLIDSHRIVFLKWALNLDLVLQRWEQSTMYGRV